MASSSTSSNSMSASALGSSPLHRLASYFQKARKRVGTISLPKGTLDTIKKYREEWSQHSEREVDAIVRTLEPNSADLCKRLDSMALVIICSVLVHTESCLAQQRGLCLLAESLHGSESTSSIARVELQGKKIATGQQALIPLVKGFTKSENPDHTRRWMGVLALELLKGCEQNVTVLKDDTATLESLKEVIEHGRRQVLRLLAGSIIRTLLCAGVMPEIVWPTKTDMELYSQFPMAEQYDTQWIIAFEGFVEGLGLRNALTQEASCVIFAFALFVGPSRYVTDEESAILVTVSEDLNIIIPNSITGPATYIDVPLDHIDSAIIDSRANSQSQTPSHVLVMKLSNDDGKTCYFNASENDSKSIALVFAAENDAKALMRLIQSKAVDEKKIRHYSQSEAIDISQALSDGKSEEELAVPSPRNIQELRVMPTQAATSLALKPPPRTSPSASKGLPTTSQCLMFGGRLIKQSFNAAQYVEHSMSVAMGVDVSQPAPLSNAQDDARSSRRPLIGDIANEGSLRNSDRTSDTALPSSLRWTKANGSVDNAPEIRNPESNVAEQQAAGVSSPQQQAEDYDSTYDVSPKNDMIRPDPSKLNTSPSKPLRRPKGNQDDRDRTDASANPETQGMALVGPDAVAGPKLQQSRKSKVSISVPGPPNTGDGSTDKAPRTKLSRRLRNIEGDLDSLIGQSIDAESHSSAKQGVQAKTRSKFLPKCKASAIAETRRGVQKPAKQVNKLVVMEANAQARVDHFSDKGDEYDLRSSPEPIAPIKDSAKAMSKVLERSQLHPSRGGNNKAETMAVRSSPKASNLSCQAPRKAKALKPQPRNNVGPDRKLIWGMPPLIGEDSSRDIQREGAKQADTQSLPALKEKKASRPPVKPKPEPRSKAAPAALTQPRSRRAAAIKANRKLQGLEENDEVTDVDDLKPKGPTMKPSAAVKKSGNTSGGTTRIDLEIPETAEAPPVLQPRAQRDISAVISKNNVKIDATRHKMRDPTPGSNVDTSSPEKIDLIQDSSMLQRSLTNEDPGTKNALVQTDPLVPYLQTATVQNDCLIAEPERFTHDRTAARDHKEWNEQPDQPSVPDNVSKFLDVIPDTEASMASDSIPEHYFQPVQIDMMGDTVDSFFQEAMLETDGASLHPDQAQRSPDTAADVKYSERPTSVRNPLRYERGENAMDSRGNHSQVQDPFETKLGPLVPKSKVSTDEHRAAQGSANDQMIQDQKTLQAKPPKETQRKPVKQLKKVKEANEPAKSLPATDEVQRLRPQQNVPLLNNEMSEPAPGQKRSMDDDYRLREKSVKMRINATNDTHVEANERKQATDGETPLPTVSLKPGLISWTVSGPRNQGTISAMKRIPANETHVIKPHEGALRVEHDDKQDLVPCHAHSQIRAHTTPRHNPKHVPPMIPQPISSVLHERAHRLGSQSTRVNENGSPMAFVDQSPQGVRHGATPGDLQSASDDDEILVEEDDYDTYEPQLPIVKKIIVPQIRHLAFASMTSNRKQVPSSPHAPSTHAIIPPHVILHSGEMVNKKTLESIVPTLPQDPFVGGNPRPPSSFMKLLRESTAAEGRQKSEEHIKKKSSGIVKRKSLGEEDDPDRTLVEPEPKRQKKRYYTHPNSSSTSEATSRDSTLAGGSSDQESDSTTIRWEKTLEPHQANMLDVLSHITHRLVRHLVDKETAANDIVNDYKKGGDSLLQRYVEGRRKDLESDRATLELSKEKIAIIYTQAQANVRKTSKDMSKRPTCVLEARMTQWHHQQKDLGSAIDRAIAACAEG